MRPYLYISLLLLLCVPTAKARVIYVNAAATGLNNGSSWTNAFNKFDSVCTYQRDTTIQDTVWIANGLYQPFQSGINRFSYHIANNGLKIYGGFDGTETSFAQRNAASFQTIFDGGGNTSVKSRILNIVSTGWSIGGVPTGAPGTKGRPARPRMIIDGIKFTNGWYLAVPNAVYGKVGQGGGAIMYYGNAYDTLDIRNCYFYANASQFGGALFVGRYLVTNGPTTVNVSDCVFESNSASSHGGAIGSQMYDTSITGGFNKTNSTRINVSDCLFSNNSAAYGGAVGLLDSFPVIITRSIFRGNTANRMGGVFFDSSWCHTKVYNSLIVGNRAPLASVYYCRPPLPGASSLPHTLVHCTIASNRSVSLVPSDYPINFPGGDTIRNCIFWDNVGGAGVAMDTPSLPNAIANNILERQAGLPNTVNTYSIDPRFIAPGSATSTPFPASGVYDYHLQSISAAIDTAIAVTAGPGLNTRDLDSNNRLFAARPDLGAYERSYCATRAPSIAAAGPLTFCQPDSVKLTASAAGPGDYYWGASLSPVNPVWARDSGLHHVIRDSAGCRAKASILVRAVPIPGPVITKTNNTLSIPASYASYQWYKAGVLIPGATSASYNPTSNGVYTVRVTTVVGGCTGTSTPFQLTNLSSPALSFTDAIVVYPNPARDVLHIQAPFPLSAVFTGIDGRVLLRCEAASKVDIGVLPAGVYHISFRDKNGTHLPSVRLVKLDR